MISSEDAVKWCAKVGARVEWRVPGASSVGSDVTLYWNQSKRLKFDEHVFYRSGGGASSSSKTLESAVWLAMEIEKAAAKVDEFEGTKKEP